MKDGKRDGGMFVVGNMLKRGNTSTHTHLHIHTNTHIYTQTHAHTHTHTHTHRCKNTDRREEGGRIKAGLCEVWVHVDVEGTREVEE